MSRHWLRWQLQLLPRSQQQSPGHCHLRCAKTSLSHFKCLNAKKIKKHSFFPPEAGPENLEAPWDCTCKAASKESPTCACRRSQAILLPTSKMHSKCPLKTPVFKEFRTTSARLHGFALLVKYWPSHQAITLKRK